HNNCKPAQSVPSAFQSPSHSPSTEENNMAAANVLAPPGAIPSPDWTNRKACREADEHRRDPFDPRKHLNFSPPPKVFTMADIGLPENSGVSPLAVSEPFPLFTEEAIRRM